MSCYIVSTDCINTIATALDDKAMIGLDRAAVWAAWMMADNVEIFNNHHFHDEPADMPVDFYQQIETDFNDVQQVGTLVACINEYSLQCRYLSTYETSMIKSRLDQLLEICMTAITTDDSTPAARIWPKESEPAFIAPSLSAAVEYVCSVDMLSDHHHGDRECLIRGDIPAYADSDGDSLDMLIDSLMSSVNDLDESRLPFDTTTIKDAIIKAVEYRFTSCILADPDDTEIAAWVLLTW